MINYIRHDEECYYNIKLTSGDEVIGKGFASIDEDTQESIIYIEDPLEITVVIKEEDEKLTKGIGLNKWINFSDEDFYIIREKDIVCIASLSQDIIMMYEMFLSRLEGRDEKAKKSRVELDSEMGHKGKVDDIRKSLDWIYKNLDISK